jgi:hypothetical protein
MERTCLAVSFEIILLPLLLMKSVVCMPVFSRPLEARSHSSTCTSSSGADTPPLSSSDRSEGSQLSIDLSHINIALVNATHPVSRTYLGCAFVPEAKVIVDAT